VVTGLFQSDGTFGIGVHTSASKLFITVKLTLELTITSWPLSLKIQSYFGCGRVTIDQKRQMCKFEISDLPTLWHIIIPHFLKYPFFGDKHQSFIKYVKNLTLMYPYYLKNKPNLLLSQILYLGYFLNPGSPRTITEYNRLLAILNTDNHTIFNSLNHLNGPNKNIVNKFNNPIINIYFILGVIEGDGCFYVGLRSNRKVRFGFNIGTHIFELDLLYRIKWWLNCGIVSIKAKTWCRYDVEGNKMLRDLFIALVETQGGLLGSKKLNFDTFKEAMSIFTNKGHKTDEGLRRIVEIAYNNTTNKGKSRKLSFQEYLKVHNL
jgi:LAGLIDADG endonuclease